MKFNIVTIDPSLNCTALIINDKKYIFVNTTLAYTETKKLTKWFALCAPYINYNILNYKLSDDYSNDEIIKLESYDTTASIIQDTITLNIDTKLETKIFIEGYSYNSAAGKLIDLVTFSTLIRKRILEITPYLQIIPPSTLKLEAAKFTYPPIVTGKKVKKYQYKNNEGISGGNFKKPQMAQALIENETLNCEWVQFLRTHKTEILAAKSVAKPLEDMNDAKLMYEIFKN